MATEFRRIRHAQQLKSFTLRNGIFYPFDWRSVRIELDKKKPVPKKEHQIIYQQGSSYGSVGDYCYSIDHEELLELERSGAIRLT